MINSPTEIPNCIIWLDGADVSTMGQLSSTGTGDVSDGDPVGLWRNKVPLTNKHFSSHGFSDSTRPTYVNSISALRFNNDYLSYIGAISYTEQTVFVVTLQDAAVGGARRIYTQADALSGDWYTGSGIVNYIPLITENSTTIGSYANSGYKDSTGVRGIGALDIYSSRHTGNSIGIFVNNSHRFDDLASHTLGTLNIACSRIGADIGQFSGTPVFSSYYNANILEVIVFDKALNAQDFFDVHYYLTRKWNSLQQIPRGVYALRDGNWSATNLWSVSAEPPPWNTVLSTDSAFTNSFQVTADVSAKAELISNFSPDPFLASGRFSLTNGVSLSANVFNAPHVTALIAEGSTSATLVGNVRHPAFGGTVSAPTMEVKDNASVNIFGDITNQLTTYNGTTNTLTYSSSGILNIYGNITGSGARGTYGGGGVVVEGDARTINVYGNITGGGSGGVGISTKNTATNVDIFIKGDIVGGPHGSSSMALNITNFKTLSVIGNILPWDSSNPITDRSIQISNTTSGGRATILSDVIGYGTIRPINITGGNASMEFIGNVTGGVIDSTSTQALSFYGNIINDPNGRQAIYARRYQVFPNSSPTYTRHSVNGYDSYLDYWTPDVSFTITYPPSTDVVKNVTYANTLSVGSMIVPPTSAVALYCPIGDSSLPITNLIPGENYQIIDNPFSTSDFTLVGAENNNIGTKFTALSSGVGLGKVKSLGKASLSTHFFWYTPLSSLSSSNPTMGMVMKNITETPVVSSIVLSLDRR